MIIIGVDIGIDGGVAAVDRHGRLLEGHVAPSCRNAKNGRRMYHETQLWYLVAGICKRLRRLPKGENYPRLYGWIEESGGYGRDGKFSHHSRGWGYGLWRMALIGNGVSFSTVSPAKWKSAMFPGVEDKSNKQHSIDAAVRLFGESTDRLRGSNDRMHDGICEAALIAVYGRRRMRVKGAVA